MIEVLEITGTGSFDAVFFYGWKMKKLKKFIYVMLCLSSAAFFSCQQEESSSKDYAVVTATKTADWAYSSSNAIFEVDSSVKSVNITGNLTGKTVYLVKENPTDYIIDSEDVRYISGGTARSAVSAEGNDSCLNMNEILNQSQCVYEHYKEPEYCDVITSGARTVNGSSGSFSPVTQLTLTAGTTTKKIYLPTDSSYSSYTSKECTLKACGTYCNIWVSPDVTVSDTLISTLQSKFDTSYPLVRNVFGNESEEIYFSYNSKTGDFETKQMNYLDDTSQKVNIVLFDIPKDNVCGFFSAKDYYANNEDLETISGFTYKTSDPRYYSNEGKYFYVDSALAASNDTDALLTLVHEFQHMICFGTKTMSGIGSYDGAFNEMMSMLCEDLMLQTLYSSESSVPAALTGRLQNFNAGYMYSGLRELRSDSYSSLSYATAYAFGAWVARKYGGAELIHEMASNGYVNNDCLIQAIKSVKSMTKTMDELVKEFILDVVNDTDWEKSTETISGTSYTLSKVSLTDSAYSNKINGSTLLGPVTYYADREISSLRPAYGLMICLYSKLPNDASSVTINFTTSGAETLKMYLIIK